MLKDQAFVLAISGWVLEGYGFDVGSLFATIVTTGLTVTHQYKQGATCRRGHPPTSAPKSRLSIAPVHDQSALSRFRGYNREQLWPLL